MLPTKTPLRTCWPIYWTIWNLPSFTCCTLGSCCASRPGVKENLPSGVSRSFNLPSPASMSSRPVLPPDWRSASARVVTPGEARGGELVRVHAGRLHRREELLVGGVLAERIPGGAHHHALGRGAGVLDEGR